MNAPNITDSPDAPLAGRSSDLLGRVTENLILITAKMLEAKAVLQANAQWEAADEILTAYEAARRAQKIIEAKPRVKWCAHISTSMDGVWTYSGVPCQGSAEKIGKWICCPICGAPRPNPRTEPRQMKPSNNPRPKRITDSDNAVGSSDGLDASDQRHNKMKYNAPIVHGRTSVIKTRLEETPKTDASEYASAKVQPSRMAVDSDFARTLERQAAMWQRAAEILATALVTQTDCDADKSCDCSGCKALVQYEKTKRDAAASNDQASESPANNLKP